MDSVLPCTGDAHPLGHLKSSSGKSWAQLKQTNESWRQDLTATKTSVINSAHPNPLKTLPGSSNTAAVCQPQLPVAGKAKLFLFLEWCHWSCCRVGPDLAPWRIREVKRSEGKQEAGMCNGALGLQEIALEPDHSVAPQPLPHFQPRKMLQPF